MPSIELPEIFEALLVIAQEPSLDYSSLHALVTRLGKAISEPSIQAPSDLLAAHESLMNELHLRSGLGFTAIWQYYAVHAISLMQINSIRPSLSLQGPSPVSLPKPQSMYLSGAHVHRSLAFAVERRKRIFELAVSFVSEPSRTPAPIGVVDCETDEVCSTAEEQSEELTTASSVRQRFYFLKNRDGLGRSLACSIYNCSLDQHHSVK